MSSTAVARINAAALLNNLERVCESAPGCRIMAVVKANAYGHGLEDVARVLDGADAFAVARVEEGIRLRRAGTTKPVVVLSGWAHAPAFDLAREHDLDLVVHNEVQIERVEADAGGQPVSIWLEIDSGMGRLGIGPAEAQDAVARLRACPSVGIELRLMTHLACADELENPATTEQLARFADAIGDWDGDVSIANSAAVLAWPETLSAGARLRYSGANWVRPGLMLYGITPFATRSAAELGLMPAMSFESELIALRHLPTGSRVGYGGAWQASRDSVIGVIGAGYGDGYPWRLPREAVVIVNGAAVPVVGRISMDLISVDLTDAANARIGDRAVLWGAEPEVTELAGWAETIAYDLVSGVSERVQRICE